LTILIEPRESSVAISGFLKFAVALGGSVTPLVFGLELYGYWFAAGLATVIDDYLFMNSAKPIEL